MVITGLTRNIVGSVTTVSPKTLYSSAFTPRAFTLLKTCISQFSRNLVSRRKPIQFYMETYRSGHNGADSKSVREQSPASSNLAVSAKDNRNLRIAVVFFCYGLIFITACDIINLISDLIYFQHLFFIGRGYKNGRGNLDHLLDIREPMKILILVQFSL